MPSLTDMIIIGNMIIIIRNNNSISYVYSETIPFIFLSVTQVYSLADVFTSFEMKWISKYIPEQCRFYIVVIIVILRRGAVV